MAPLARLAAAALAAWPWTMPDGTYAYDVAIAADAPPELVDATVEAMSEWRAVLPELRLARVAVCGPGAHHVICVGATTPEWLSEETGRGDVVGLTTHEHDDEGWTPVVIDVDACTDTTLAMLADRTPHAMLVGVVAHEIGHAMGLKHLPNGTLMAPDVSDQPTAPTDRDVRAWRAVRR